MPKKKQKTRRRRSPAAEEFSGKVILEPVSPGSKSERMAVQLDTGSEKLLLRRVGVRGYRDSKLEEFVGKKITGSGIRRGSRLYLKDVESE